MPQQLDPLGYDPRTGQSYDPRYLAALQGTPAWSGFAPTQPVSLLQVLQALAQWMGMALPGRGGLGRVAPTAPMRTRLRTPKETEDLGKLVDQGFRDWMRENVTGRYLPSPKHLTEGSDLYDWAHGRVRVIKNEREAYENLLSELFATSMGKMVPGQSVPMTPWLPPSSSSLGRQAAFDYPQMPIVSHGSSGLGNPMFWLVE